MHTSGASGRSGAEVVPHGLRVLLVANQWLAMAVQRCACSVGASQTHASTKLLYICHSSCFLLNQETAPIKSAPQGQRSLSVVVMMLGHLRSLGGRVRPAQFLLAWFKETNEKYWIMFYLGSTKLNSPLLIATGSGCTATYRKPQLAILSKSLTCMRIQTLHELY